MRKPVCLALLGISIVVAAASLGTILTRYLGLRAYSPKVTAQAGSAAPAGRTVPAAPAEEWNNLFAPGEGMKTASRLPAANAKSGSQARSAFVLVGTIASSTPSARRAILWANGMKEPKAFREKEEVEPGAVLASVERDKVWIARGKEREKLEILPVGSPARGGTAGSPAAPPRVASPIPPPSPAPGISPLPRTVAPPVPSPDRARPSVAAPKASPGDEDEEELSPRDRRRRIRSLPR